VTNGSSSCSVNLWEPIRFILMLTQYVWASTRTNEVCSHASSRFGWASDYVCWSMFKCEWEDLHCTTSQSDPHTPLKPEQGKANRSLMTWRKLWGHNQAWVAETPSQDPGQTPCKSLSQKESADPRHANANQSANLTVSIRSGTDFKGSKEVPITTDKFQVGTLTCHASLKCLTPRIN